MIKVAVCFYGFMRSWQQTFSTWNPLFNEYNPDIFIYTWDTETYKPQELGATPHEWRTKLLDVEALTSLYKPKAIVVNSYKNKFPELMQKCQWVYDERDRFLASQHPDSTGIETNRIISNYSMWYTWSKVAELKRSYGEYDIVLLTRSDYILTKLFDFNNVVEIHTPPWPEGHTESWTNYEEGINDHWIYGPSKDMDVLCTLYDNAESLWDYLLKNHNFERIINPHKMPVFHMRLKGIPYIKTSRHGYVIR